MAYYLKCNKCGRVVSSAIPGGTNAVTVRAWIECPECIAAKEQLMEAMREPCEEFIWTEVQKWCQRCVAKAAAAEQEACAKVAERVGEALKEAGIHSDYCCLIATNIRNMHQECKTADELEAFIAAARAQRAGEEE